MARHGIPRCTDQKVRPDPCLTGHGQQLAPTHRGHRRCLPRRWSRRHIHRSRRTWPVAGLHSHHARLRIIGGRKRPHRPTVGRSPHQRRGRSRHASPRIGRHRVLLARGTRIVPESYHHGAVGRGDTTSSHWPFPIRTSSSWSFPARYSCRSFHRLCKAPETPKLRCTR